ncbi:hypothetical protein H9Q13_00575 [Pontibacter sp. JH31]|uniref:SWFGD domain-containing protein n=1 Tax=Pontibacter aquaedesilientis TaxID=2766980 RepID=A0ABR7XBG5_9BACT|nr:hypothetical protein [Pontibacter aquaedesilientis]MBD1395646.1 hypothetical protein [Pontibacter aquaedesilientis]
MNRYSSDRDYGQHESSFHTHRSERYRHPERDFGHRFDDYGSPVRGGYGNQSDQGTWGNQGNEMGGSRRYEDIHVTPYDRFEQSHNYGNMGSYGGAQGFGDSRGGHHDSGHPYDSGTDSSRRYSGERSRPSGYREEGRHYGRNDQRQHDAGRRSYDDSDREDLYGHETSRRFQGSRGQGRYDFERDDYYSSNYGDDQGNYMGGGYHRTSRGKYSPGDYGSSGFLDKDRQGSREERKTHEFNTAKNRWNTDW